MFFRGIFKWYFQGYFQIQNIVHYFMFYSLSFFLSFLHLGLKESMYFILEFIPLCLNFGIVEIGKTPFYLLCYYKQCNIQSNLQCF